MISIIYNDDFNHYNTSDAEDRFGKVKTSPMAESKLVPELCLMMMMIRRTLMMMIMMMMLILVMLMKMAVMIIMIIMTMMMMNMAMVVMTGMMIMMMMTYNLDLLGPGDVSRYGDDGEEGEVSWELVTCKNISSTNYTLLRTQSQCPPSHRGVYSSQKLIFL